MPDILISLAGGGGILLAGGALPSAAAASLTLLGVRVLVASASTGRHRQAHTLRETHEQTQAKLLEVQSSLDALKAARVDSTDRSNTELMALRVANAKLKKTITDNHALVNKALEENRYKSSFLANMSHELRTPLNAIIGLTELSLETSGLPGKFHHDLEVVRQSAVHLLRLVEEVLDMSKIEAGKMDVNYEVFPIAEPLEQVARTAAALTIHKPLTFKLRYSRLLGKMKCDRTKLFQILTNLAANACKFTDEGSVELSAEMTMEDGSPWIVFQVTDTGIGIPEDQRDRLFQPFTQTDESPTRVHGGSGLGLALVRHFCDLLGGRVSFTSTVGEGSTFTVALPREPHDVLSEGLMMISVH